MNKQEILNKMFDMDRRYSEEFKQLQQAANELPDNEHGRAQPLMDLVEKWRLAFANLEKYCERLEIDNKKLSEENTRLRMELDSASKAYECTDNFDAENRKLRDIIERLYSFAWKPTEGTKSYDDAVKAFRDAEKVICEEGERWLKQSERH